MTHTPDPVNDLRAIPARWAVPDPAIVSRMPKGGTQLDYVGHADITLALIEIDPMWSWAPAAIDPATGGPVITKAGNRLVMWGTMTVHGKALMCVGTCEERKADPEKELVGDLIRNGAMRFGIATALWSKSERAEMGQAATPAPKPKAAPKADANAPTQEQFAKLNVLFGELGFDTREDKHQFVVDTIGRDITSAKDCTKAEVSRCIEALVALSQLGGAE
jgi:hypothetical protein